MIGFPRNKALLLGPSWGIPRGLWGKRTLGTLGLMSFHTTRMTWVEGDRGFPLCHR